MYIRDTCLFFRLPLAQLLDTPSLHVQRSRSSLSRIASIQPLFRCFPLTSSWETRPPSPQPQTLMTLLGFEIIWPALGGKENS